MSSRLTMIAGTPVVRRPRAGAGRAARRARRPVLPRRAHLPAAHRAGAVRPREPGRGRRTARTAAACRRRGGRSPTQVEQVVRRALAPDRDDRWPDVPSYVAALRAALGDDVRRARCRRRWLPLDPELTQPGARPTSLARLDGPRRTDATAAASPSSAGCRAARASGPLVAGAAVGYALYGSNGDPRRRVRRPTGTLSVTVPSWTGGDVVASDGWRPPARPAAGTPRSRPGPRKDWASADSEDEGIFVGLLPGTELPTQVPQHPECRRAESAVTDVGDLGPSVTVVYRNCPGGT